VRPFDESWVCQIEEIVKFWKHLASFLDLLDPLVVAGTATLWIAVLRKYLKRRLVVSDSLRVLQQVLVKFPLAFFANFAARSLLRLSVYATSRIVQIVLRGIVRQKGITIVAG